MILFAAVRETAPPAFNFEKLTIEPEFEVRFRPLVAITSEKLLLVMSFVVDMATLLPITDPELTKELESNCKSPIAIRVDLVVKLPLLFKLSLVAFVRYILGTT